MPFIERTNPVMLGGLGGTFANLQQNQRNAHTLANPQGSQGVFGSILPDSVLSTDQDGGGVVGGSNAPNAADRNGRQSSGLNDNSQNCMTQVQLSANLNTAILNHCGKCDKGSA